MEQDPQRHIMAERNRETEPIHCLAVGFIVLGGDQRSQSFKHDCS